MATATFEEICISLRTVEIVFTVRRAKVLATSFVTIVFSVQVL
jgi:hypothetical protein